MASDDEFVLEPCPCCGGKATMEHGAEQSDNGWVVCTECGLSTRYYDDPAEAAKAWNMREAVTDCNHLGNAAAMREALVQCELFLGNVSRHGHPTLCLGDQCTACNGVDELRGMVVRAISAPARNCDMPYNDRVEMYGAFKDWCKAKGHTMEPMLAYDAFDWLLAPAAERDGDGK